jgi:hypothetical protein
LEEGNAIFTGADFMLLSLKRERSTSSTGGRKALTTGFPKGKHPKEEPLEGQT